MRHILGVVIALLNFSCGMLPPPRVDPTVRAAVVQEVTEAERERLRMAVPDITAVDQWIRVVVDDEIDGVAGVKFYRARNDQTDPPVQYVLARGTTGELFRLGGFGDREAQFDVLIRGLLETNDVTGKKDAIGIADAYFEFVEQWLPGIPETLEVALLSRVQNTPCANGNNASALVKPEEASLRVTAVVSDSRSGRVECVEVTMSRTGGFDVARRTILNDGRRIEL